jgi:hypothetical protein
MTAGASGTELRELSGRALRGPGRAGWALGACAAIYLAAVWLDAAGVHGLGQALPAPIRFFTQVAELFPRAAEDVIEWRVKAYRCAEGRYEELDARPFFPIHRDDKESRYYRTMFFYYRERRVLDAVDAYITGEQNRLHPEARIGGVMLLSLRIPIPKLGVAEPRYQRRAIADYPATLTKKYWYNTAPALREQRCAETP